MKSVFIETENVTRFNNATKRAVDFQRGRPGMMMITAPTGYGKTVAAQQFPDFCNGNKHPSPQDIDDWCRQAGWQCLTVRVVAE